MIGIDVVSVERIDLTNRRFIEMVLTDEERQAMGENGRRLVESKYQWNEVARRMAGVYEKCVNAGLR